MTKQSTKPQILTDEQIKKAMKSMFNPGDYLEEGRAVERLAVRETLKMVGEWLKLYQASSEPIQEMIPYYGGKSRLTMCKRYCIPEQDLKDFLNQLAGEK